MACFNCRSISSQAQLSALIAEADRIQYDVIGLCETKRKDPFTATWNNGVGVYLGARKSDSISGGVGFLVNPSIVDRIKEVTFYSHRLGLLILKVYKKLDIAVFIAYAPTLEKDDEEHVEFYDDLRDVIRKSPCHYKVVLGDFNARVGPRQPGEWFVGPHSEDVRNAGGERLASFCETTRFYLANSFFTKPRGKRWTYLSVNGTSRHEIDYILSNRRIITNVSVLPSFTIGSDHRLVRANVHFDQKVAKLHSLLKRKRPQMTIDIDAVRSVARTADLRENADLNVDYEHLVSVLQDIHKVCQKVAPNQQNSRLTPATKELLSRRRSLFGKPEHHVEFCQLSKLCRKKVAEDHAAYSRERRLKAA